MIKYLRKKKLNKLQKKKNNSVLKNGVPCKLDSRGNAILNPLTQPLKLRSNDADAVDPTSINQPFFVIKGENGTKMIYRESSIKNLMANSIVRYDDPAVLEKAKTQMGMTVRFQYSCICKGGRQQPKPKLSRAGKTVRQKKNAPCSICA